MNPRYWHNWVRNQEAVAEYYAPRGRDELQAAVRAAARRGKVRTVGRSYAWSPLIPTRDSLIDVRRLDRLLDVKRGGAEPTITVEAGMSMRRLTELAGRHGLTLKSPTIFPKVSIGGVVATGSHGTGRRVRTFSDAARTLTFVAPGGELHQVRHGTDEWRAAAVGLGAFGPLYSVELAAERAFNVRVEEKLFPVDTVLAGIVDAVETYEFVEMYWFPFSDRMWLMAIERTAEPADRRDLGDWLRLGAGTALAEAAGYAVIPAVARRAPQWTPLLLELAPHLQFREGVTVEPAALAFHYLTAYPMMYDMEYAVPLAKAALAWRLGMDLVRAYAAEGRYPVNFVMHARYIRASDAWMSPAHHPDRDEIMCMIEVVTGIDTPGRDEFFARLATLWADAAGGRPHWGKMLYHPRRLKADYGQAMREFEAVRRAYDPERVYLNDFLEREVLQLA